MAHQCPLCPFADADDYVLQLHVEEIHFSEDSPFVVRETSTSDTTNSDASLAAALAAEPQENGKEKDDGEFIPCPEEDCGEQVPWSEMQEHLDFHFAEKLGVDEEQSPLVTSDFNDNDEVGSKCLPRRAVSSSSSASSAPSGFQLDDAGVNERLGRKQLGPYAWEERMPAKLIELLQQGGKRTVTQRLTPDGQIFKDVSIETEVSGLIPVIASLLADDPKVKHAWLCHPGVQHIHKLPGEGGFCGYRNIQMMISYIKAAKIPGWEAFRGAHASDGRIMNILELQDMIERAWDMGFNTYGRFQTGGVKGTRKYIGSPEVEAILRASNIPNWTERVTRIDFGDSSRENRSAHECLMDRVESYFADSYNARGEKVISTTAPPMYYQQPMHSLTIIGYEIHYDGRRNMLVFDPAFKPSKPIMDLLLKDKKKTDKTPKGAPSKGNPMPTQRRGSVRGGERGLTQLSIGGVPLRDFAVGPQLKSRPKRQAGGSMSSRNDGRQEAERMDRISSLLKPYRRNLVHLRRYSEFEMVRLIVPDDVD